ncbi:MAG: thymidine kinase [Paracholeplasma sp.]|jgi:thymidine kinase|uniref:Thymidine kinase n=1 Tax=Acholeplasma brassicae TaxID=61635 RepID=U4KQX5_9MOLU|nr:MULTISPECIES: thymidine kinase [Paracholeplasma]MDY3196181.1 thymidine kinase [Paracholeplasma sp.]CCV65238.1 Thymidine kinase [Paracholeplasma brassicae]HBT59802.1 thymidine kinase [Acholeplasmataceae bacterium]
MHQPIFGGWIEVVCGPMFAGKTEEIIRRIRRLEYAKKNVLVFKPTIDNRYATDEIVSHNKTKAKSININQAREILDHIKENTHAVVIDEAQFLDDEVVDVAEYLANKGIRVIVGGLDRDFRGEPFGPMPQLLAVAEFVVKLTAICVVSGQPATRTQRLINGKPARYDDEIVLVGASESYEPRSREFHEVIGKVNRFEDDK